MSAGLATLDSRDAAHAWLRCAGAPRWSATPQVQPGDVFVAWPGDASDGRASRAPPRSRAGAVACLVEAEGAAGIGFDGEPRIAALRGLKAAAGDIASRFLGSPSEKLDVVAVTGTNGKTSTAGGWRRRWRRSAGAAAVIGTLGMGEPPRAASRSLRSTGLTTPDPVTLQNALADFVGARLREPARSRRRRSASRSTASPARM